MVKRRYGISVTAFSAALLLLLAACSGEEGPSREPQTASSAVAPAAGDSRSAPGEGAEPLVYIQPKAPRVTDDLQAVVRGAGAVSGYAWARNGVVLAGEESATLPSRSFLKGDEVTVTVSVGGRAYRAATVIANSPPRVQAVVFADPHVRAGVDLAVTPEGFDADGDPVEYRYTWSVNGEVLADLDAPILPGGRLHKGDRVGLQVLPDDGTEQGNPVQGEEFVVPDSPPRFVSEPPREFNAALYLYQARAVDPDGDPLTYALESGPDGMQIDSSTGRLEWKVGKDQAGEHAIRISVRDDEGMRAVQEYTLQISITE